MLVAASIVFVFIVVGLGGLCYTYTPEHEGILPVDVRPSREVFSDAVENRTPIPQVQRSLWSDAKRD